MVQEYLDKATQSTIAGKKSFVEKYAGSLNGQLSDKEVKRLLDQKVKDKYGY